MKHVDDLWQVGLGKAAGQSSVTAARDGRTAGQCVAAAVFSSGNHIQLHHVIVQPADGPRTVSSW